MSRVLIVQAGARGPDGRVLRLSRLWFHGLTLPYLAALFGQGREVRICDDSVEEPPLDTDADLVAVSAMGVGLLRGFELADAYRSRGKTVVLGGLTASTYLEEAKAHADAVVIGEAEGVVADLLADHDAGHLKPVYQASEAADLALAPVPRYDLLQGRPVSRLYPVETSRGCASGCEFCLGSHFYARRHRTKPAAAVERDVRAAVAHGAREIIFVDDNPALDPTHFDSVVDVMARVGVPWTSNVPPSVGLDGDRVARMARSGCYMVSVGFESLSAESLGRCGGKGALTDRYSEIVRQFHRHGIEVLAMLVVGFDEDGPEVFERAARFLEEEGVGLALFHVLTPIRATPLWERLAKENRLRNTDLAHHTAACPIFEPAGMSREALEAGFWHLYNRLYSFRSILGRVVLKRWRRILRRTAMLLAANLYVRHLARQRRLFI